MSYGISIERLSYHRQKHLIQRLEQATDEPARMQRLTEIIKQLEHVAAQLD